MFVATEPARYRHPRGSAAQCTIPTFIALLQAGTLVAAHRRWPVPLLSALVLAALLATFLADLGPCSVGWMDAVHSVWVNLTVGFLAAIGVGRLLAAAVQVRTRSAAATLGLAALFGLLGWIHPWVAVGLGVAATHTGDRTFLGHAAALELGRLLGLCVAFPGDASPYLGSAVAYAYTLWFGYSRLAPAWLACGALIAPLYGWAVVLPVAPVGSVIWFRSSPDGTSVDATTTPGPRYAARSPLVHPWTPGTLLDRRCPASQGAEAWPADTPLAQVLRRAEHPVLLQLLHRSGGVPSVHSLGVTEIRVGRGAPVETLIDPEAPWTVGQVVDACWAGDCRIAPPRTPPKGLRQQ